MRWPLEMASAGLISRWPTVVLLAFLFFIAAQHSSVYGRTQPYYDPYQRNQQSRSLAARSGGHARSADAGAAESKSGGGGAEKSADKGTAVGGDETGSAEPCYEADGRAKRCTPEFRNVALGRKSNASSTCGNPPNRYCSVLGAARQCQLCDARNAKRSHPPSYLVDVHSGDLTCWISHTFDEPQRARGSGGGTGTNVSVVIALEKKYEVSYIVMPFCNKIPDSMALYKSADFGRSWTPLQYYSSTCRETYGLEPNAVVTKANEQEAVCTSAAPQTAPLRVAFSFVDGRPSANQQDSSPVLRDWMTLTDVMIVFHRLNPPLPSGSEFVASSSSSTGREYNYISLSDVSIGGRCKCNGHASRCVAHGDEPPVCDCKHNTAGDDCERCKPFYFDRPWDRATPEKANECVPCECNLHSRNCNFNKDLFLLSGRISGGVCVGCRHNTAGRHCHYCAEGFFRDFTKPMNHRRACRECKCHPHGSVGRSCNQSTGQCLCKDGVMGIKCDRCRAGFVMSRNPVVPCESTLLTSFGRLDEGTALPTTFSGDDNGVPGNSIMMNDNAASEECETCRADHAKLDIQKYCKNAWAIHANVTRKENAAVPGWAKFAVIVQDTYKRPESSSRVRRGEQFVYARQSDLACGCPKIKVGKHYIMVGSVSKGMDGIALTQDAFVVQYMPEFDRRMRLYVREEKHGCDAATGVRRGQGIGI